MKKEYNLKNIINIFNNNTKYWCKNFPEKRKVLERANKFKNILISLHYCNFLQWNLESRIRKSNLSDKEVVKLKREIDLSNNNRNSFIGKIDKYFEFELAIIYKNNWEKLYLNSETLGQIIDRISILTLKYFFLKSYLKEKDISSADIKELKKQIDIIKNQIKYIYSCYRKFIKHLKNKKGYMIVTEQFKKYNLVLKENE